MADTVYTVPTQSGGMNDGTLAALMQNSSMNSPFAWIVLLALMNGGFGGNNGGANALAQSNSTQLYQIQSQLSNSQNTALINSAVQGNADAISQLAQTLGLSQQN